MTHIDGDVPEPDDTMEHYVHMHIDYKGMDEDEVLTDEDGQPTGMGMGVVHLHVHNVPGNAFIETLVQLAVQNTAQAMLNAGGPFEAMPEGPMREHVALMMAREYIAARAKSSQSTAMFIDSDIPDDASSLFTEGQ